jgi:hypothetical protein
VLALKGSAIHINYRGTDTLTGVERCKLDMPYMLAIGSDSSSRDQALINEEAKHLV